MAEGQSTAAVPKPTRNPVPEMVRKIAAAKATGKFTFQAGRMDGAVNLAIGGFALICLLGVGQGGYFLATGKGKKDI